MMGKVIMSGIVPQLVAPVTFAENFADNTWEQIIKACQTNAVPDTWAVGDQKSMTIDGTDYLIDIIGKNHDTYVDGGTAPLTFQFNKSYNTGYPMNSSDTCAGGWADSAMRNTHLPIILSYMPTEIKTAIREVRKVAGMGSGQNTTLETSADKLFLLAAEEVFGKGANYVPGEGSQYAYYAAGNTKIKTRANGTVNGWWTRSTSLSATTGFWVVNIDGTPAHPGAANANSVAPAFCF